MARKQSDLEVKNNKANRIMKLVAWRCAYYRANPHRFVKDYFGITLKLFQKILIWGMNKYDALLFIASRGLGKTYLVAIFGCVRCILYPGTKVVVCSDTFKQAQILVAKIENELMHNSVLLDGEIIKIRNGQNKCEVLFRNGSTITAVVSNDTARGNRSHILIIDEARKVPFEVVDKILRPMSSDPRHPKYMDKPEYAHMQEMNKEITMSSATYASEELTDKVKAYLANMLTEGREYFVCDLPYQLSIKEGLLMRQQIENEMSEATFSEIAFSMEREGIFYGSSEDALFSFEDINKRRLLEVGIHNLDYYRMTKSKMPAKQKGEVRLLSVDVALLASKKHRNDASALIIHSGIPTPSHYYLDNIMFIQTEEGLSTEDLGLEIMRFYYQYDCDYIVLDANGVGLPVLDYLMADRFDPVYGEMYGALNVINNDDLAERCKSDDAPKVIYAIYATPKFNNDMTLELRSAFNNGKINLLVGEMQMEENISQIRGFSTLSDMQIAELKLPYVQTTYMVDELINLSFETKNGLIKVKEKSGMRKDRYSSLAMGYHILQELSVDLKPTKKSDNLLDLLEIKPAKGGYGAYGR